AVPAGADLRGHAVRSRREHRRHARRDRSVSREAQARVQGQIGCAPHKRTSGGEATDVRAQDAPQAPLADASPFRFAVVVSRFNETVTNSLRDAATGALKEAGATDANVQVFSVPGAYEIPQAARAAAEAGRFDAIVCLGCIIRGETPHFDYIASAVAHGITQA